MQKKGSRPAIRSIGEITYKAAIIIGLFQLIAAVFPGTSRSGATIIGALIIGVSRSVAAEFTFFLAVPVMFGASLLKIAKYAAVGMAMTGTEWVVPHCRLPCCVLCISIRNQVPYGIHQEA